VTLDEDFARSVEGLVTTTSIDALCREAEWALGRVLVAMSRLAPVGRRPSAAKKLTAARTGFFSPCQ